MVCVCACVRQLCSLIRRANSIHGEFNTRTTTKQDRTVNWKYAGKYVDVATPTLTATATASLKQPTLVRCGLVVAKLSRNDNSQANGRCWLRSSPPCSLNNNNIQVSLAERNVKNM